jgi:hypothetical protein
MMKIETLSLDAALAMAHPKNPKEHDLPALVESFQRFGFVAPPTIDEKTKTMVAGHGRCEALASMRSDGHEAPGGVEVVGVDWRIPVIRGVSFKSDIERDAYVLADNQHVMNGGWNFERLTGFLVDLGESGYQGLGFPANELDSLLGNYAPEPDDRPDDSNGDPSPDGFVRHDINVKTTYCCPKCSYEWSGKPK